MTNNGAPWNCAICMYGCWYAYQVEELMLKTMLKDVLKTMPCTCYLAKNGQRKGNPNQTTYFALFEIIYAFSFYMTRNIYLINN